MTAPRFRRGALLLAALIVLPCRGNPSEQPESDDWKAIDGVLGREGRDLQAGVRRYVWPRTDLEVSVHGTRIEPALALGSWAAFHATGQGSGIQVMGDLVLLGSEVNPVVASLQAGGLEVLAIHNHLIDEIPRLMYVHFGGRGDVMALAKALRVSLQRTKTPLEPPPGAAAEPSSAARKTFETIQAILGRKGTLAGRVLQIGVPRRGRIEENGMEVPVPMGMAIAMSFQADGSRAATTGDFVLVADEVDPVVRELQAHGLSVTALHSHMLREEPRLFFLHFWGLAAPERIAEGLKAALSRVATRP
jgi:hypothetical protein